MQSSALRELLASLTPEERRQLEERMRGGAVAQGIRPRAQRDPAPLSAAQRSLWFLHHYEPESPAYNELFPLRLRGTLDPERLQTAFQRLLHRHESLRSTFELHEGEPVSRIHPPAPLELPLVELDETRVGAALERDAALPFDLEHGPLLRLTLYRLGPEDHVLSWVMHHIVVDGWSFGVLLKELTALYQGQALPEPELQYADYAAWQQGRAVDLEACRGRLEGAPELLPLPTDHPRPAVLGSRGGTVRCELPSVTELAGAAGVTPYVVLLAAFATVLQRYTGVTDLVLGTPSANRTRRELEPLVGFFVNTLVVRLDLAGDPTFRELLGRVREGTLAAFDSQEVPFETLVEALRPRRDASYHPLFQVMFGMEDMPWGELALPGLTLEAFPCEAHTAKFDLTLSVHELGADLTYHADLFERSTAERMATHLHLLLTSALQAPDRRLSQLDLLDAAERELVTRTWNATACDFPRESTVVDLFRAMAQSHPRETAVICGERQLTYAELDETSERMARALEDKGVGPETGVGLKLERSLELVVAVLAVLKAGGWYVPLDPADPPARRDYVIESSGVGLVVDGLLEAEGPALARSAPDRLAYVLYTSGSTGRPKGAMVTHRSLVNRLLWFREVLKLGPGQRVLLKAPLSFDFAVHELLWPLVHGATLVVARPDGHLDPAYLVEMIERHGLVTMHFAPAMLALFLDEAEAEAARLQALKVVTVGAEALAPGLRDRCLALLDRPLFNLYGPTEATIDVSWYDCRQPEPEHWRVVSLGRPVHNTALYVLDPHGQPCPIGVPGELCVGGVGLARGYLGNPALTARQFVPDPFSGEPGARLYRTGDLVRWRASGQLEFLGRLDHQVKLRGLRIELGEIEAQLQRHPGVREAAVGLHGSRLVAWVAGEVPPEALREHLRQHLPEWMVPADFVALERLPRTVSAKVDRARLPAPERAEPGGYVAPRPGAEETLCGIWAGLLGRERVGARDNFFELGGDSILSIQVVSRARAAGLDLSVRMLFEHQTPERLAAAVPVRSQRVCLPDDGRPLPLTPIQHWYYEGDVTDREHYFQSVVLHLPFEPALIEQAIQALIDHHGSLRRHPVHWSLRDSQLWLAIHHLGVDAVSWRILLEDLETACGQLQAGKAVCLPRSSSFAQWAERLQDYRPEEELERWRALVRDPGPALPRDREGENTEGSAVRLTRRVPSPASPQESLLRALGAALRRWTGQGGFLADVEGHGREELFPELDLTRTVGWFTALYPVRLDQPTRETAPVSYGVLRYLAREEGLACEPEIGVNYLGRLDGLPLTEEAPDEPDRSLRRLRRHVLEVEALTRDGQLEVTLVYSANLHEAATMTALADRLEEALRFPLAGSVRDLPQDVEDVYPLTPMQQGMLFHTLYAPGTGVYESEISCTLQEDLDADRWRAAWEELVRRHPSLRTSILWDDGRPLQVVHKEIRLPWNEEHALDVSRAPLLSCRLEGRRFTFQHHHLLLDGWCLPLLWREARALYAGLTLPPAPPFRNYLEWLARQDLAAARAAWQQELAGFEGPTPLVLPAGQGHGFPVVSLELGDFTALARRERVTQSTLVQAAWALLLSTYSGESDVIFGLTVAGRPAELSRVEEIVGLFINTVPVRVDTRESRDLGPWLRALQDAASRREDRHFVPLAELGGQRLFESLLVFENYPTGDAGVSDVTSREQTGYPLTLVFEPGPPLAVKAAYDAARFSEAGVRRLLEHLKTLLERMTEGRATLAGAPPAPLVPPPVKRTIVDLFLEQVRRAPAALATEGMTYAQLHDRSDAVARQLGAHPGRVAVDTGRTPATLVAFLGILKAGGVYVPLDPDYPAERRRLILEDSGARLLTEPGVPGEPFQPVCTAASPAYLVYTSGSSGRPKGVLVGHAALARLAQAQVEAFGVGPQSGILQLVSPSFDVAIADLAMAVVSGARVVFGDPRQSGITHLQAPPAALTALPDDFPATTLIVGGEVCPPELVARWSQGRRFFNAYGPTEACVCATFAEYAGEELTLGRPLPHVSVHVLDGQGRELPDGVPGELFLGGGGLAEGYLNDPALTAERFRGGLYRSGDRVRRRNDGQLEFLGRADEQVKIRGFRVELGEVEAHLREFGPAAVVKRGDRLVAYLTHPDPERVRARLQERLPDYLQPSVYVRLERLPLLPSGKVDRSALPEPERASGGARAPRTPVEEIVAGVFREVLGGGPVGLDDDFFALGGHSLTATQAALRLGSLVSRELPLRLLFEAPTVAALAERLLDLDPADVARIPRTDATGEQPLSYAQERMWFLDRFEEGGTLYTIPQLLQLEGPLDADRLVTGLVRLVERHEQLRTVFRLRAGVPCQEVTTQELVVERRSVSSQAEALRLARADAALPFDLERMPVRATLYQVDPHSHLLYLNLHHIVADGWSMATFFAELAALYRGENLPPQTLRYLDFALWQREWLRGERRQAQLQWWREHLAEAPPLLELPTDRPRPRVQSSRGATLAFELEPELVEGARELARRHGLTLFMVAQAALALLFSRYSRQDRVVLGAPIANRNQRGLEGLVGYFLNVLPLCTDLSGNPTWVELLERVRAADLAAYERQDLPFEYLVDQLHPVRRLEHAPLFQVLLFFQNLPAGNLEFPGLTVTPHELACDTAKLDLTLTLTEEGRGLRGAWEYNTDLFDEATIRRFVDHLKNLWRDALAHPRRQVSELVMLGEAERHHLLVELNRSERAYPGRTALDGFAAQVARTPDRLAVVFEEIELTYAELDRRSDLLAAHLVARGVGPEVMVAVCSRRSHHLIVAFLGILKAGGAYVPLDPAYPEERLRFMLADSGAPLLISEHLYRDRFLGDHVLYFEDFSGLTEIARLRGPQPCNLAYMIYTSGSTGQPKAAMVIHEGMLNHLYAKIYDLGLHAEDRIVQNASQCFDISIWQMLAALLVGACIHVVGDELAHDPVRLFAHAEQEAITILEVVPSVLGIFLAEPGRPDLRTLRWLIPTGEALQPESCRLWFAAYPGIPMINAYGPSECSDDVTHHVIREAPGEEVVNMPVGRPVINTQMYVLDPALQPVPIGVAGELCVGGRGVGRGYRGRPDLTAKAFVPSPFAIGARLYKTGDLARYLPDGTIEFLGRLDHQIKIRGFRIELGEVESALREFPGVREAVVVAREDRPGHKQLVAYVAREQQGDLGAHLRERLPEYMVPSAIVELDSLPTNANGKVDRKALPAPVPGEDARTARGPRDRVELGLVRIWEEVLKLAPVGIDDDFFELGGNSLLAVQLMSRVERAFERRLPLSSLFLGSSVAEFAKLVREGPAAPWSALVPIQPRGNARPLFLLPGTGGQVLYFSRLASHLGADQPVYALQPPGLDGVTTPFETIEELAAHHLPLLREVQPEGPYRLAGHSFGSLVAFEMAQQLVRAGERVELLAVLDTPAPGVVEPPSYEGWDEADWLNLLAELIGSLLGRNLPVSAASLRAQAEPLEHLHRVLQEAGWSVPGSDSAPLKGMLAVYQANTRARYAPAATVKLERIVHLRVDSEDDWGWKAFGTTETVAVGGTHITMLAEPHVGALARELARRL